MEAGVGATVAAAVSCDDEDNGNGAAATKGLVSGMTISMATGGSSVRFMLQSTTLGSRYIMNTTLREIQ